MRLLTLSLALLLAANAALSQTDTVALKVNGRPVCLSEFKYCYNRDCGSDEGLDRMTAEKYLPFFVSIKLGEAEGYALRLDTASALKAEYADVRDKTVEAALVSDDELEAEAQRIYNETKANVGSWGLVRPAHILLYVRQDATNAELERTRHRADSLYLEIKNGADFAQLAKKYSQDEASARNGGTLPWIQPNQTWKEFEDAAYALNVGEVSRPVQSPMGFHIIKALERKQIEPYDSLRSTIMKMLTDRGIRKQIVSGKVNETVKASGGTMKPVEALSKIKTDVERNNPEVAIQLQVLRSELLCYAAYNKYLEGRKPFAEATLKAYFNKNKKRYYWDEPRFKGIVIHAKKEEYLPKAIALIKDAPYAMWDDMIEKEFNSGAENGVSYEKVLCKKGENKYVDSIFGKGRDTGTPDANFPYTDVYGKNLKKKAVSYEDVRQWVKDDYEEELRQQWTDGLRKEYPVEVFNDVLQTVNQDNK